LAIRHIKPNTCYSFVQSPDSDNKLQAAQGTHGASSDFNLDTIIIIHVITIIMLRISNS